MVAGTGNRVLGLAARKADIVARADVPSLEVLLERVAYIREQAGDRFDHLELNIIIFQVAIDREPDPTGLRALHPDADDDALLASMNLLHGPRPGSPMSPSSSRASPTSTVSPGLSLR